MSQQLQFHLKEGLNFLDSTLTWFTEAEGGGESTYLRDDYHILAGLSRRVDNLNLYQFVQVAGLISPERIALLNEHKLVFHSVLEEVEQMWDRKMRSMDRGNRSPFDDISGRCRDTYDRVVDGLKMSISNLNHETEPVIALGDSACSSPETSSDDWEPPSGLVVHSYLAPRRSDRNATNRFNN